VRRPVKVLEEPDQQDDDDDERQKSAANVHASLLFVCLPGDNERAREVDTAVARMAVRGDVAEWLGRGLQSLVQRFESARRL
jgi:hypothetical protein